MKEKYFKLAEKASEFSDCKIKIGSVLVYKNKVLSVGYNTNKSHPIQKMYNKYRSNSNRVFDVDKHNNGIHAEMMCLLNTKDLDIEWSKVSIYVARRSVDKLYRLCKPCGACMLALKEKGVKNIYYTTPNGYYKERMWKNVYA